MSGYKRIDNRNTDGIATIGHRYFEPASSPVALALKAAFSARFPQTEKPAEVKTDA